MSRRGFVEAAAVSGLATLFAGAACGCSATKQSYDVVVVGAGVTGCCVARELARYDMSVLVAESGLDIANGATRANSSVVHVGFDPKPGTLKAKYNVAGAKLYPQWQEELGFAMQPCGSLVLAFDEDEKETLERLHEQGVANGAEETRIIDAKELREIEPHAPKKAVAALYAPTSSIVDPYGLSLSAAENAVDNGVEFVFASKVTDIARSDSGFTLTLQTKEGSKTVAAKAVLNAAGVFADEVNNMVSSHELHITPKRGEYRLYEQHPSFGHIMFQAPTAKGKGVLVGSTVFGNAFIGPNARAQESKTDVSTTLSGLEEIFQKAKKTWPDVPSDGVISTFAGLRATNADTGDFVVGQADDVAGFFNAACIDSPGLASAPAIAQDLAAQVAAYLGAGEKDDFNPKRESWPLFAYADEETKAKMLAEDPAYGVTVCSCYNVTKAEVVRALHGKLPVLAMDALKWRTGVTMGACQGSKCLAKIVELVMQESDVDAVDVQKRVDGSYLGPEAVSDELAASIDLEFDDGVFEKPRAAYCIPGARCAGIYSGRDVLELMARDRLLPGNNIAVWGETDIAKRAIEALERAGASMQEIPSGASILEIVGDARVEAVVYEGQLDEPVTVECDCLVISKDMLTSS